MPDLELIAGEAVLVGVYRPGTIVDGLAARQTMPGIEWSPAPGGNAKNRHWDAPPRELLVPVPRPGHRGSFVDLTGRQSGFTWEDKLHLLRREIHFRRRYDADRVARGRTTAAAAAAQRERLEAVQHKYWWDMFTWSSPTAAPAGTPAWRAEVREHTAKLELGATTPCSPAEAGAQETQEAMPV